jgi:hypothetical protein
VKAGEGLSAFALKTGHSSNLWSVSPSNSRYILVLPGNLESQGGGRQQRRVGWGQGGGFGALKDQFHRRR